MSSKPEFRTSQPPSLLTLEHEIAAGAQLGLTPEALPIPRIPRLPIYDHESDIISAITSHSAVVLISPTGTGKSLGMPKLARKAGYEVIRETQPRRQPTVNVGSRLLFEMGIELGEEKASEMVSWQTGAGLVGPRNAQTQIMTEGVLVRKEGFRPTKGTNEIMLLDEMHERGKLQTVLAYLANQKRANNSDFTVVHMSAHLDKYSSVSYLTDAFGQEPAVIELTAPMYGVEYRERQKSDLIKEVLLAAKDIHENPNAHGKSNTIQVFESGVKEIQDVIDELWARLPPSILADATILANHAKLSQRQRELVYQDVEGLKIVVQTNIGKTSNTIPRTRYVITQGRERQIILDAEGRECLVEVAISQDCFGQQSGRTGRNNTGIVVHTKREGEEFIPVAELEPHLIPEIQRTTLDDLVLYFAARGENLRTVDLNHRPDTKYVELAMQRMQTLGAIDSSERITKVGHQMFNFAASPEGQRSMVEAMQHPESIRLYMAAMIAATEVGGLKRFADDTSDGWVEFTDESKSDLLSQLDIFIGSQSKTLRETQEVDINIDNLLRTQELYRKLATSAGIDNIPELLPPTAAQRRILRQCIIKGYVNDIFLPQGEDKFRGIGHAKFLREISNRSIVPKTVRSPIIGSARSIQAFDKGKRISIPIIENVTQISWPEVGRFAVSATEWALEALRPRGDEFIAIEHQTIGSKVIDVREVPAEPGPRLRAAVIERVKDAPGKSLLYLYKIKSDTEALAHKSKAPIKKLTQDMIDSFIEGATPESVTNPSHVEENLRQHIVDHKLSLDTFVTERERASIIRNAPDKLMVGDMTLKLFYRQGKPIVYVRNSFEVYRHLPDNLQLRDGRDIVFRYDDTSLTIAQLKNRLRAQGML
jgi:HrpA-like RNA helicase